ncbi:DUF7059 domain-containing protein [Micrococcus terreus]|uniref:DUF7059 domain-containing protein n=1 Tax=Micrococcus terreus TaxID=574650 RepID=UPI003018BEBD
MSGRPFHRESLVPRTADLQALRDLAADLRELPYTTEAVEALLGPVATQALDREQAEPARLRLSQVMPDDGSLAAQRGLAAVVSAWMLGDPVPVELLDAALPRLRADGAARLELGWIRDGMFHPVVDLSPYSTDDLGDLWVASDQTALQARSALPSWHVLGIGRASLTLAGNVDRRPVERALDLGSGCGIQTLHLLPHAQHVTATDLSERALEFTRFNLVLNAPALGLELTEDGRLPAERIRLVQGDLLEPVTGEHFDLIVSNPPFVITPRDTEPDPAEGTGSAQIPQGINTYRDGGRTGDRLLAELITRLPEHLTPGGTAQLLGNWEIHTPDTLGTVDTPDTSVPGAASPQVPGWDERLRTWVPQGTDAWFIQRDLLDAAGYAETWLQDSSEQLDPEHFAAGYRRYLEDFEARGVAAVGFGYLWLRRPAEPRAGRIRTETVEGELQRPLGPAWAAAVERWDLTAGSTPGARGSADHHADPDTDPVDLDAVRALHLQVPPDVTEERHQRFGAADPEVILARQGGGFRRVARLDTATAGFLAAADGEFTAGQLAGAIAGLLELDADGERHLLLAVADLLRDGFLIHCDAGHA